MPSPSDISKRNIGALSDPNEVIQYVSKEIAQSEKVLGPWKSRIVKYYELYKMHQKNKHYEGLANIFVPEILRAVETVVGNLYKAIVGSDATWFEFVAREDKDAGSALAMTQLVQSQMDQNNFKSRLMDSLRQMAITGLTVRKVMWDYQVVMRKRPMQQQAQPDPILNEAAPVVDNSVFPDTIRDHWTFEPVDLLSFHISDITTPYNDIQKARWIAEQYLVDKPWIKDKYKKGWLCNDQDILIGEKAQGSDMKNLRENRSSTSGFSLSGENDGKIEIVEYWGLVKAEWVHSPEELAQLGLEKDELVEAVIVVANRRALLKLEANPFWHGQKPYVSCPYVPQEFEFDGIGISQIAEKLQEELNDTRNQTMDNKTLILMTMWLKSRTSGIKNSDLRVRPLGVITTNDMTGLQPLRPPVLTGVGVNIEGTIKEDLRQSVGASSNLQGIAQAGVDTATESSLINKESFGRLLLTAELYGELILKPALQFAEYLNYQFFDHVKAIRVIGANGVKFRQLKPEELAGWKDVIVRVSMDGADNPAVKRQQLIQFFTVLQQMAPEQVAYHWHTLDKIYGSFFPGRSLDELYQAPPEAKEVRTVDEEIDLIVAEYPVEAQMLPDGSYLQRINQLTQEFDKYKFSLSPESFEIFKSLIMGYQQLLEQDMMARQAQMEMQMQAQAKNEKPGGLNTGQAKNMTPFTQTNKPENPQQSLGA
jgi:hypothetical protein